MQVQCVASERPAPLEAKRLVPLVRGANGGERAGLQAQALVTHLPGLVYGVFQQCPRQAFAQMLREGLAHGFDLGELRVQPLQGATAQLVLAVPGGAEVDIRRAQAQVQYMHAHGC